MQTLLFVAIVCACGGAPRREASGPAPPTQPSTPAQATAPTAAECDDLFAHAVELAAAERPDPRLTDDDRTRVRGELAQSFAPACRAMTRDGLRCSLAAHTLADLDRCGGYATRNSSTSNSSVAPGGIKPPAAPRSP